MYYNECPYCGAALDPNEKCDCQATAEIKKELAHVGERERKQNMINSNNQVEYKPK